MSSGCTTSVAMEPALRPAMDSTCAVERPAPAWLEASMGSCAPGLLHGWVRGTPIAWFYGDVGGGSGRILAWVENGEKLEPAFSGDVGRRDHGVSVAVPEHRKPYAQGKT